MENKVAILYFSGTGNTAAVANLLRDGLLPHRPVDVYKIEDITLKKAEFDPQKYGLIGIGYPSYGFNPPSLVTNFVKKLNGSAHNRVFLFMTCAGPCYINYIAGLSLKRILRKRGFRVAYEKTFGMAANVLIRFGDEISRQLWNTAVKRVHVMAADLIAGCECVRRDGAFAMVLRWTYIWAEKLMLPLIALDYKVNGDCVQCMKCVENCPRRNISLKNGKIRFGVHCMGCYRCVYGCPRKAIKGRLFKIMIFNEGYDIGRIIRDESIRGDYINKDTKGIFKTLYKYLNE